MVRWAPSFRAGVKVGVVATLLLCLGLGWAWLRVRSADCEELPREDLSLREMAQLRRRVERFVRADRSSWLELSGREASFLVREQLELPAWVGVDGTEVSLEARIAGEGRCWNVGFRGHIEVDRGRPFVAADHLRVGRLEIGGLIRGRRFELPRAWLPAASGELFQHLSAVQVADGTIYVRLDDPGWIQ